MNRAELRQYTKYVKYEGRKAREIDARKANIVAKKQASGKPTLPQAQKKIAEK